MSTKPQASPAAVAPAATTAPPNTATDKESPPAMARFLYTSYFFAAWGDRMWEFAAIIFLLEIFPDTLFPSSVFGFCEALCGITAGPRVGKFIDGHDRLKVIRTSVVTQNSVIYAGMVIFNYSLSNATVLSRGVQVFIFCVLVFLGMVAKAGSMLNKISIHKDWSVVLAKGSKATQTHINSSMRRVDLTCSILAPMAVGILSGTVGPARTCICVAVWSACSIFVEWHINQWVYHKIPDLQIPKQAKKPQPSVVECGGAGPQKKQSMVAEQWNMFVAYVRHPAFGVSLPYCLLYSSLLSFGGIIVSFLRTLGCSDALLAAGRGTAALVAIGATVAVPPMVKRFGLVKTGLISNYLQLTCLLPLLIAFAFLTPGDPATNKTIIALVFVSICCSRFGLWAFDLAETQLMQEMVLPQDAGKVNGAQDSLVNFCWLLSFIFTMVYPNPKDFKYPAFFSFTAVAMCGVFFTMYAVKHSFKDPQNAAHQAAAAAAASAQAARSTNPASATAAASVLSPEDDEASRKLLVVSATPGSHPVVEYEDATQVGK